MLACRVGRALWGGSCGEGWVYLLEPQGLWAQPPPPCLPFSLQRSPCLHSQSRHKGISSVCPQAVGGGATCPANSRLNQLVAK